MIPADSKLYTSAELADLEAILLNPGNHMAGRLALSIAEHIPKFLPKLEAYAFSSKVPLNRRATWALDCLGRIRPKEMVEWLNDKKEDITQLEDEKVITSILNMIGRIKVDSAELVHFYDFASKQAIVFGSDNRNYYALKVMDRIACVIPELKQELKIVAEEIHERTEKPYLKKYTLNIIRSKKH